MKKTSKRALIIAIVVFAAAACLTFGALNARNHFMPRQYNSVMRILGIHRDHRYAQPRNPISELYQQKHPYIGRVPVDLIKQLTTPAGLYHNGFQQYTVEQPYGMEQFFGTDHDTWEALRTDPARQTIFQKNALIIMALIENCNFVMYSVNWADERFHYSNYPYETKLRDMGQDGFTFTYTRAWADAVIDGDIKQQADSEEAFRIFLEALDSYELSPVEPEKLE